jgi:hypothetical protein
MTFSKKCGCAIQWRCMQSREPHYRLQQPTLKGGRRDRFCWAKEDFFAGRDRLDHPEPQPVASSLRHCFREILAQEVAEYK